MAEKLELTDSIIRDIRKLSAMNGSVTGLDGITVDSCWQNGQDTAVQEGYGELSHAEFQDAKAYYAVVTARLHEIL